MRPALVVDEHDADGHLTGTLLNGTRAVLLGALESFRGLHPAVARGGVEPPTFRFSVRFLAHARVRGGPPGRENAGLDGRLVVAVHAVPPPVGAELPDLPMSVLSSAARVGKGVPSAGRTKGQDVRCGLRGTPNVRHTSKEPP